MNARPQSSTLLLLALFSASLWTGISYAEILWPEEGVPVTIAPNHQLRNVASPDGNGGAILVWEDFRIDGLADIYGQRIDHDGNSLWEDNGVALIAALNVYGESSRQSDPAITNDDVGGAIFVWEDTRNGQSDIFAQKIDSAGNTQWQDNGVPICTACFPGGLCANAKQLPQIAADSQGSAIITWFEIRDGLHFSVWAQKIDSQGNVKWTIDGVPIATGDFYAMFPKIVSDGADGAIIAWQDNREGSVKIYAQRVNGEGAPLWTTNGINVSEPIGQTGPDGFSLISGEAGGAIFTWVDRRDSDDADIFAQKLDGNGNAQWQVGGVQLVDRPMDQYDPKAVTDGKGGVIVAWEDPGASPPGSGEQWIYAQRVDSSGRPTWMANGVSLYTDHGFSPKLVSDHRGGAIVVWNGTIILDPFTHIPSIFAQHIDNSGKMLWGTNGASVYGEVGGNYGHNPQLSSDGKGGGIIHWTDYRYEQTYWDIFAQRVRPNFASMTVPAIVELLFGD